MPTLAQIAATLPEHDPLNMRVDQISAFLQQLAEPVAGSELVDLHDALDRVLAEDLMAPVDVPPHDNSAMDGFAFDGSLLHPGTALALEQAPGCALAGQPWHGQPGPGQCVRVMTGAVMPAGLDTVVPQESVHLDGNRVIVPPDTLRQGANRRVRGEDLRAGTPALRLGQRIGPAALGLIASLGIATVAVQRRLKVAYFSTGDELLSLGDPPRDGAVYDSNRYALCGLLRRMGIEVRDLGVIRDDPQALAMAFRRGADGADALITSGGVSTGDADHTKALMHQLGDMVFWRIAMRPGRPLAVGRMATDRGHTLLLGLPGNPVAAMVAFLVFVRPTLRRMMGCARAEDLLHTARCQQALRKRPGRTEYQRGIVSRLADGSLVVRPTDHQGSGVLRSMVEANALLVLHHEQGDVAIGDEVDVLMFEGIV